MDITRNIWKYYHYPVAKGGNILLDNFLESTMYFKN